MRFQTVTRHRHKEEAEKEEEDEDENEEVEEESSQCLYEARIMLQLNKLAKFKWFQKPKHIH